MWLQWAARHKGVGRHTQPQLACVFEPRDGEFHAHPIPSPPASHNLSPSQPQARQLLQFAALAAVSTHLQSGEVLAPAQLLPQVSRVLLQTEEPQAKKYLEAIATALAGQIQASLLFVDAMLLASLAGTTFGTPPEAYLGAFSGTRGGTGGLGRAAPKLQFAWLALREVLFAMEHPTGEHQAGLGWRGGCRLLGISGAVVQWCSVRWVWSVHHLQCSCKQALPGPRSALALFSHPHNSPIPLPKSSLRAVVYIRNVEQLLAGSYDAFDAFIDTFGKTGLEAALEGTASHAPLVLLGGITVNESAAALAGVRPQRQRQAGGEGEEAGDADDVFRPHNSGGVGHRDLLPGGTGGFRVAG